MIKKDDGFYTFDCNDIYHNGAGILLSPDTAEMGLYDLRPFIKADNTNAIKACGVDDTFYLMTMIFFTKIV